MEYGKQQFASEREKKKPGKKLDRLTRDAIAAQQAGESYGKWKAKHPHTPDEDDEETDAVRIAPGMVLAACLHCGQTFQKKAGSVKKYCSEECRNAHHKKTYKKNAERMRAHPGKPAVCRMCGADFMANHRHRFYCSTECAKEGQRLRQKELKATYKKEAAAHGSN